MKEQTKRHLSNLFLVIGGIAIIAIIFTTSHYQLQQTSANLSDGEVKVPVLMYHSILNDSKRSGKYVITPDELEKDLVYLKDQGFETVLTSDLINFVEHGAPLPEKPIVITFDDGYYNNYSYLYPALKKHGMKAVLSIVGTHTDLFSREGETLNNNYSHVPWNLLKEMQNSGVFEIQNHTYDLHDLAKRKGILRKKGEDAEHYKEMLISDITRLQETATEKLKVTPTAFTYPFGAVNKESEQIINSLGFQATYGSEEGINTLVQGDSSCLYKLKRYNRSGTDSREEFFSKIFKILEN